MMIDALLKYLGMEIDEDNLDDPLKQIGDGFRVECFGICGLIQDVSESDPTDYSDGKTNLPLHRVLTSRDWIFIKECIVGGPLPPKGISLDAAKKSNQPQELVGRPEIYKEFLYDVVSNRHSGLDVDKIDYLARDDRRAFGSSGQIDPMFIENAHVAWGECSRPENCFRRKHLHNGHIKMPSKKDKFEKLQLMIVYPEKMVQNAMNFFKLRFRNHQKLYTHHNTNAACYMVCDILLLAEPYIRISAATEDEDDVDVENKVESTNDLSFPISRANAHPQSYLLLKDSILDVIAMNPDPNLRRARCLINRFRSHKLYKKVAEQAISNGEHVDHSWQQELWSMDDSEIAKQIVKHGDFEDKSRKFSEDDIIVEKRKIHHGMGDSNPVNSIRFLPKSQLSKLRNPPEDLPTAEKINEIEYECCIPRAFLQKTIRIYCRKADKNICDFIETCYHQFIVYMKKKYGCDSKAPKHGIQLRDAEEFPYPNVLSQSPARHSNAEFAASQSSFPGSTTDYEPVRKRRKPLFSSINEQLDSP